MKQHRTHTASLLCLIAAIMSTLVCVPAFAEDKAVAPAIPPGQENLLLDMLGPGAPLPGCELVDGQVNYTVIKLTYDCANKEIEYELAHRSRGGDPAMATDQFAITLKRGSPPRGFGDALVSLVRARETEFEWVWPDAAADSQ